MAKQLYANRASGYLSVSLNTVATSLTLQSGQGAVFPSPTGTEYFLVTLFDGSSTVEICKVTGRSSDTLTIVRGQEGTTAATFPSGSLVEIRATKGTYEQLVQKEEYGNVALGKTLESWTPSVTVLEVQGAALYANTLTSVLGTNYFANSSATPKLIEDGYALAYRQQSDGSHVWQVSQSGTGGDTASFIDIQKFDSLGRVLIGTSTARGAEKGSVTISTGNSGFSGLVNSALDDLVIENNTSAGVTILTPSTAWGYFGFADEDDSYVGGVEYSHDADKLQFMAGSSIGLSVASTGKVTAYSELASPILRAGYKDSTYSSNFTSEAVGSGANLNLAHFYAHPDATGGGAASMDIIASSNLMTFKGGVSDNFKFTQAGAGATHPISLTVEAVQTGGGTDDDANIVINAGNGGEANIRFEQLGVELGMIAAGNGTVNLYNGATVGLAIGMNGLLSSQPTYDATATGSNVVVTSSGAIRRTSSSIKYKKDVEDLDDALVDNAVKNLRPVYYRTKDAAGDDKASWSHLGLIAEEVDKVEPRLCRYRTVNVEHVERPVLDEEGNPIFLNDGTPKVRKETIETELETPEPEDVDYARLSVILLKKVQQLEARIAVLEAK